jgi:hypothetical protein
MSHSRAPKSLASHAVRHARHSSLCLSVSICCTRGGEACLLSVPTTSLPFVPRCLFARVHLTIITCSSRVITPLCAALSVAAYVSHCWHHRPVPRVPFVLTDPAVRRTAVSPTTSPRNDESEANGKLISQTLRGSRASCAPQLWCCFCADMLPIVATSIAMSRVQVVRRELRVSRDCVVRSNRRARCDRASTPQARRVRHQATSL